MDIFDNEKRHLPNDMLSLPTVRAQIKYEVGPGSPRPSLEGPAFDREGNFYCCLTKPGDTHIKKITPDGTISEFYHCTEGMSVGIAFHKDGRAFITNMSTGELTIHSPSGEVLEKTVLKYEDHILRADVGTFDSKGDLYISDLSGTTYDPIGSVYSLSAESNYKTLKKFMGGMASPNGIKFASDDNEFWYVETNNNALFCMRRGIDGKFAYNQMSPLRVFQNKGNTVLDTFSIDQKGYIYLGVMFGGRYIILDNEGVAIANVIVPGFEEYKLRYTPNLAIHPFKNEAYAVASDENASVILSFKTAAPSQKLYAFA